MAGSSNVAKGAYPKVTIKAAPKGKQHVASGKIARISSGKMASVPHVTLGTTHGNHSAGHAVN